jgi:hypothetical protein
MKQCPQCNRNYEDDSLRFCLDDGAVLRPVPGPPSAPDPNATLVYGAPEPWRHALPTEVVEPPITTQASAYPPPRGPIPRDADAGYRGGASAPANRLLVGGVIAIALLLLIAAVIGAALLFRQNRKEQLAASGQSAPNSGLPQLVLSPSIQPDSSAKASSSKATDELNPKTSPLKIKVAASSVRYSVQSNTYDPANTIDGSQSTAWIEGVDGPGLGEWIRFDFDREINLHRILILPGYFKSQAIWASNNRISAAAFYFSDGTKRIINFPDRMERQKVDVGSIKTRWVRIELEDFYFGKDPDTAISEVAFEWEP